MEENRESRTERRKEAKKERRKGRRKLGKEKRNSIMQTNFTILLLKDGRTRERLKCVTMNY